MGVLNFLIFVQIITSNTFFESPSAKFPSENIYWEAGLTTSFALKTYKEIEKHPSDLDLFGYASFFQKYLFALKIYTLREIAADFSYSIFPEKEKFPALAIGIRNLSYKRYINPAGGEPPEGGFRDENYAGKFRRNPEVLSLYAVTTKAISDKFEINLGIGRGEFVGYGPRSKYLNIDYYLNSYNELAFGLFGGIKINILPYLSFISEIDGRDLNIGLKILKEAFSLSLAFTKLEGFMFVKEEEHPFYRFTSSLTINSNIVPAKPLPVYVTFNVYDREINEPLKNATIKFLETNLAPLTTDEKGFASCELMPGIYMAQIEMPEYKTLKIKLNVKKERRTLTVKVPLSLRITRKEQALNFLKSARENFQKGDLYKAKKDYEEANRIFPLYPGLSDEYSRFLNVYQERLNSARSSAIEYESKGQLQEAIKAWQEVLNIDPENKEADLKIKTLAEEIARKKVVTEKPPEKKVEKKVPPKEEKPKYTKEDIEKTLKEAISQYEKKNYEKAKELFQKVLSMDPDNAKAKEYLEKTERRLKLLKK
ncbi:MAG: tetratricopeptide repeat protein [candidate division WOR-3 bacterium]